MQDQDHGFMRQVRSTPPPTSGRPDDPRSPGTCRFSCMSPAVQLQADFAGQERILGRDVLNRLDMLFRGPTGEVVVNP